MDLVQWPAGLLYLSIPPWLKPLVTPYSYVK